MEDRICLKLEGANVALKKIEELDAHIEAARRLICEIDKFGFVRVESFDNETATEEKE